MRTDKWFRADYQEMIDDWLVDLPPGQRLAWMYLVGYVRESSTSQKRPNVASALSPRSASRIWVIDADDIHDMIAAATEAGHLVVEGGTWIVTDATRFVSERTLQRMAASACESTSQPQPYDSEFFGGEESQTNDLADESTALANDDAPSTVCRQTDDLSANVATLARRTKDKGQVTTTPDASASEFREDPPDPPSGPWWTFSDRPLIRTTMDTIRACPVWAKVPELDLPDEAFLVRIFGEFARRVEVTDDVLDFEIQKFGEYYRKLRPSFNAPSAGVKLAEWFRRANAPQTVPASGSPSVKRGKQTVGDMLEEAQAMTREALASGANGNLRKVESW